MVNDVAGAHRLPPTGCRFIAGDPREPGWSWCNAPTLPGKSWCETHNAIVFQQPDKQAEEQQQ